MLCWHLSFLWRVLLYGAWDLRIYMLESYSTSHKACQLWVWGPNPDGGYLGLGRAGVQLETEGCFPHNFACCIWSKPINYWDNRIDTISSKSMCRDQQPMVRIRSFFVSLFFPLPFYSPSPCRRILIVRVCVCACFFSHPKNWGGSQLWYHCPDFHHGFAGLCGVRALGFWPNMDADFSPRNSVGQDAQWQLGCRLAGLQFSWASKWTWPYEVLRLRFLWLMSRD